MTEAEEIPIDWRFQKALDGAVRTFGQREAASRTPEGLRTQSGMRGFWRDTLPTDQERSVAKATVKLVGFEADCPCCTTGFAIPSEFVSVKEHGLCTACQQFAEGLRKGVIAYRMPTLAESVAAPDIRPMDSLVLKQAVRNGLG